MYTSIGEIQSGDHANPRRSIVPLSTEGGGYVEYLLTHTLLPIDIYAGEPTYNYNQIYIPINRGWVRVGSEAEPPQRQRPINTATIPFFTELLSSIP